MKKRENLFLEVLKNLQKAGVLDDLILVGSWCQYFYRIHFNNPPEIPLIRTLDLDFLVPFRSKIKKEVNIPNLLKELDFIPVRHYPTGYIKFEHPNLAVEFLVPERGKGSDKPYEVKKFHVNAQSLRFLSMLSDYVMAVKYSGVRVNVPEPTAYILHKFIIGRRRTKKDKGEKDLAVAKELGEFLLRNRRQRKRLKEIFLALPKKWRGKIEKSVKGLTPELHTFLLTD